MDKLPCPYCGASISQETVICHVCHETLPARSDQDSSLPEQLQIIGMSNTTFYRLANKYQKLISWLTLEDTMLLFSLILGVALFSFLLLVAISGIA